MLELLIPENRFFRKMEYVSECLRSSILLRHIAPGTHITEKEIKDILKVSSTPIREAFKNLEAEGLLEERPQGGVRVPIMDITDVQELYSVHSSLQSIAVQLATKNLTEEDILNAEALNRKMKNIVKGKIDANTLRIHNYKLHLILCGNNINPWLCKIISALWVRFPPKGIWEMPKIPNLIINQHEAIIEAVKRRKAQLAGSLMKNHLEYSARMTSKNI